MSRSYLLAAAAAFVLAFSCFDARAAERETRGNQITGVVSVTRDADGKITAAELHDDGGKVYRLTLDKNGMALASTLVGEKVQATGTVRPEGDAAWLTVQSYTDAEMLSAHEQWRRMKCHYCAVAPAHVNATVPEDLQGAQAIDGRYFSYNARFGAWARDARYLWAATDNELFQISLADRRVLKTYTTGDGLPDRIPYELLSDGKTLWILCHGGVAALAIGGEKVADLPAVRCNFATLVRGDGCVWVIADTGTFRLERPHEKPVALPALPTGARITQKVTAGIWLPHWRRQTAHFLTTPACLGSRLYVGSYGDLYEFDGTKWATLAENAWGLAAGGARVWFLSSQGLIEYDPNTRKTAVHAEPTIPSVENSVSQSRLPSDEAVWVAVEPRSTPDGVTGGGLARLDLASRKWRVWTEINGRKADRITRLTRHGGDVWAVGAEGENKQKAAHPGMTYVKSTMFVTSGFCLHRFAAPDGTWETVPLGLPACEKRLVIGQDGARGYDVLVPQGIEGISIGSERLFGWTQIFPRDYFCGYYPCIDGLAVKAASGVWMAKFEHRPEDLGLQGEQPLVLNISNTGRMVLPAVGHDEVLGLFFAGGVHWVVPESRISFLDEKTGRWRAAAEPGFRFYWRATAAHDDGRFLYLGSDRGLLSRLNLSTGRFEILGCLHQRSITQITRDETGCLLVASAPAPLGTLPVQLRGKSAPTDAATAVAVFEEKTGTLRPTSLPTNAARADAPPWTIRRPGGRGAKRHQMDRSEGNFLWGPAPGGPKPLFYLKGVFYPKFLGASPDGDRLWLSIYTGLLRVDGVKGAGAAK